MNPVVTRRGFSAVIESFVLTLLENLCSQKSHSWESERTKDIPRLLTVKFMREAVSFSWLSARTTYSQG